LSQAPGLHFLKQEGSDSSEYGEFGYFCSQISGKSENSRFFRGINPNIPLPSVKV
jgi:hypothetical protein